MCGAAPVTRASGKSRTVGFRYAANRPARVAITGFADNSRHSSAWAGDCYRRAREPRCPPPTRRADRRPRLDPGHLGVLEHRHHLRPVTPPRRTTSRNSDLTKRTQALRRPRGVSPPPRRVAPRSERRVWLPKCQHATRLSCERSADPPLHSSLATPPGLIRACPRTSSGPSLVCQHPTRIDP